MDCQAGDWRIGTFCRCRKRRCACLFLSARTCLKDLPEPVLVGEPLLQPSKVLRLGPLPPPLSAFLSPLLWGEFPYSAADYNLPQKYTSTYGCLSLNAFL